MKAGRPIGSKNNVLKSKKNKELFIDLFRKNMGNISKTADMLNMARRTFYNYYENDIEFKQAIDDCREDIIDDVESELLKLIKSGNIQAIIFFLKTKARNRGYDEPQTKIELEQPVKITYVVPNQDIIQNQDDIN